MDDNFTTAEGSFKKAVDKLWHNDANVVFCAEELAFRVPRGILCAQSQVFEDMFALPQGETDVQNTPKPKNKSLTVIYAPDNQDDLYYFFLAMFEPNFYHAPPSDIPLYVTVSIFRLAHKYDAAPLVRRTAEYLDFLFPLHRPKLLSIAAGEGNDYFNPRPNQATDLLQMLLGLLEIVHIQAINWIVPSVILVMVKRYKIQDIEEHEHYARVSPDLKRMINACNDNRAADEATQSAWVRFLPAGNCTNHTVCCKMSHIVQADTLTTTKYMDNIDLPSTSSGQRFCVNCEAAGKEYWQRSKEWYWNCYPVLCGFESWDDVIKKHDVAMEKLRSSGSIKYHTIKFRARK